MKLIDLDQQIFVPITDETKGGATYEIQTTVGEFFKGCCDEFTPEVVDAIPVAWLNQKYAENEPGEDKDYDYFLWDAIPYILTEWQKEQEAQDG